MELHPNYDHDKPNKLTIKIMPDTEIKPPNIPDAQLKPEKWEFYDANLDAIKPNPEIHTFAQNLPLEKQIEKDKENQLREEYEF